MRKVCVYSASLRGALRAGGGSSQEIGNQQSVTVINTLHAIALVKSDERKCAASIFITLGGTYNHQKNTRATHLEE